MNRHHAAALRLIASLLGAAACLACFAPAVTEGLRLRFAPDGSLELRLVIDVRPPPDAEGNPALVARLDRLESELLAGWSPWSRRFEALAAAREGLQWHRDEGRLSRYERWAVVADPGKVVDFFADTAAQPFFQAGEAVAELSFQPRGGGGATMADRQRLEAGLAPWTEAVAAYLEAAHALWEYLERHPHRRRPLLGRLLVEGGPGRRFAEPTAEEGELLAAVEDTMGAVADALLVPPGQAESLDELARRVHDPFPARLVIEVPGQILESRGLVPAGERALATPDRSLWGAFAALEGRWVAPDPLLASVAHFRTGSDAPFDLRGFLRRPVRRAPRPPLATEVAAAVAAGLAGPDYLRVVWLAPGAAPAAAPPR
jgi:hypothetical protein